jgi:hypothetical protein
MLDFSLLSLYIIMDKINGYRSPKNLNLNRGSIGARFFFPFFLAPLI